MDIDVFQLPSIVMRRIGIVIVTALIFGGLGFAFVLSQPAVFRASTQILLDPERLAAVGQAAGDTAAPAQAQQAIDSQIYVMQSFSVLSEAARTLALQEDPFFHAKAGLIGRLLGRSPSAPVSPEAAAAGAAAALAQNLIITRADQSLVFTITAQHPNAARAAEIANTVSTIYLEKANKIGSDKSLKASMSLQVEAEELRKRLLEAEDKVVKFRTQNGLISTGEKGLVTDQQLEDVTQQLGSARAALEQQEINYNQVRTLTTGDLASGAIPEALQQTSVTTLRTRYAQTLDRLAELQTSLGSRHPQLQTAQAQAESMRRALESELKRVQDSVRNTYERSKANVAALETRFAALRNANGASGDARTTLAQLQSEADAIRGVYTSFVTRSEELSRQYDIGSGNSRIISEALPPVKTTRASALLVAIAGFLFGAAAGSAIAVGLDLIDGRVTSDRQIVDTLGVPVIARIAARDMRGRTRDASDAPDDGWASGHPRRTGGLVARMTRRLPLSGKAAARSHAAERQREAGVTRAAYVLTDAVASLPARIVFLSPGMEKPDGALVGDIALALADTGAAVDIAAASVSASSPLAGTLRRMQMGGVPAFESVTYRRLDRHAMPRQRSRASGSLLSAAIKPAPADFSVVDATGEENGARLMAFVKDSDAIAIVIRPGRAGRADLKDLAQALGPWRTKLVGVVIVEAVA
ncbi:GumC family protein [Rhizobium sp. DKSPLA3]|uniref:GumC family protein n=1 Tax=Rhizobium quercicola TaxID=2901226 RepID=A0A9X1NVR9_9HYPH|nr:GumC family protein [Rhizobium quercicola]MCD7111290.1 GumC family protein [Rhizobium quercicola]